LRPPQLKVSVGYLDGWIGEGQISYGGSGALPRAVVLDRLRLMAVACEEVRADVMGVDSLHGALIGNRAVSSLGRCGCACQRGVQTVLHFCHCVIWLIRWVLRSRQIAQVMDELSVQACSIKASLNAAEASAMASVVTGLSVN
jgi:hypothetical protein